MSVDSILVDAVAESGRNPVSKYQILPQTIFYGHRIWDISELDLGIWGPQIRYAYFMA